MSEKKVQSSPDTALPLAMTMGDPAGIGPDLTLACWENRHEKDCPVFFWVGDEAILLSRAKLLGQDCQTRIITDPVNAFDIFPTAIPVLQLPDKLPFIQAGQPNAHSARMIVESIAIATSLVQEGKASGVVTNPIAKEVLYDAGFNFPGHTEFLAYLAEKHSGQKYQPVMMIHSDELSVVPATIHIALKEVAGNLTSALITSTAEIIYEDMQKYFGLEDPRIAITGLNPHAGEGGNMGREEIDIITPAINYLFKKGIDVTGPHPADTLFHETARKNYDVVLGMYHDQVLVPAKTLAFDKGVNITLGLPFIRTSPDHGTAFTIAGKGTASHSSLLAALKTAQNMNHHGLSLKISQTKRKIV